MVGVEVVVPGFLGGRVGQGALEPFVGVAGMVGREVAHHPQAAGVGGFDEFHEGLVPAQQRIHAA